MFYLLNYTREQICKPGTNALDFKKAKTLIGEELFKKMAKYTPFGEKDDEFKEYQKLSFLKNNLESLDEEKVEEYSLVLGKIYRWIASALELRIEDVVSRRDYKEQLKHEREEAIAADAERTAKMEAMLADAKQVSLL